MEIILLETVERLGTLGDVVRVRPGYARNYLIPAGKAKYATAENLKEVTAQREELERRAQAAMSAAQQRHTALNGLEITIQVETNQEGKLFGSVGPNEIAQAVSAAGQELERSEVRLPDGPLRSLGEFEVAVHVHADLEALLQVTVASGTVIDAQTEQELKDEPDAAAEASADAPEADSPTA